MVFGPLGYTRKLVCLPYWKEEYALKGLNQLKTSDIHFIIDYSGTETIQALVNFLKNTSYGTFTLVVQDNKVIGYDSLVKKRNKNK